MLQGKPVVIMPNVVSRILGSHEVDGKKLGRAQVRNGKYGREELGGFKVTKGSGYAYVAVRYIAPDDMHEDQVEETRNHFLTLYAEILEAHGLTVRRTAYGLSVRKPEN
jgi:hypothetical protein